jgi:hypothetical protein
MEAVYLIGSPMERNQLAATVSKVCQVAGPGCNSTRINSVCESNIGKAEIGEIMRSVVEYSIFEPVLLIA